MITLDPFALQKRGRREADLERGREAHEIALREEARSSLAWYARVPTEANVADHPSRLREHTMLPPQLESKVEDLAGILGRARSRCSHTPLEKGE